jgi:hypothetical protein
MTVRPITVFHVCRGLLLFVLLLMEGCGVTQPTPAPCVTGSWFARYLSGHTGSITLQLEQEGSRIRGTASAVNILLLFKDAPVFGDYPSLRFTVEASAYPDYVGARFVGLFQEDGTLKGTFHGTDVTFIHDPRLASCR